MVTLALTDEQMTALSALVGVAASVMAGQPKVAVLIVDKLLTTKGSKAMSEALQIVTGSVRDVAKRHGFDDVQSAGVDALTLLADD